MSVASRMSVSTRVIEQPRLRAASVRSRTIGAGRRTISRKRWLSSTKREALGPNPLGGISITKTTSQKGTVNNKALMRGL